MGLDYAPVAPAPLPHAHIRDWAERVGDHYRIYGPPGYADLDALIASLGGNVDYRDGEESLRVRARRDFTIFLPHMTSARHDWFTQSHEIGHYFLHYLLPEMKGEMGFGRGARNGAETQANVFASSLLMPEKHFRRANEDTDGPRCSSPCRTALPISGAVLPSSEAPGRDGRINDVFDGTVRFEHLASGRRQAYFLGRFPGLLEDADEMPRRYVVQARYTDMSGMHVFEDTFVLDLDVARSVEVTTDPVMRLCKDVEVVGDELRLIRRAIVNHDADGHDSAKSAGSGSRNVRPSRVRTRRVGRRGR